MEKKTVFFLDIFKIVLKTIILAIIFSVIHFVINLTNGVSKPEDFITTYLLSWGLLVKIFIAIFIVLIDYFWNFFPIIHYILKQKAIIDDNQLYKCYVSFINDSCEEISNRIRNTCNPLNKEVDLAWESSYTNDDLTDLRRKRVLEMNSCFAKYSNNLRATECFLYDVITDNDKWGDEKKYWKKISPSRIKRIFSQRKKKSKIIILTETEYKEIQTNHLPYLKEYLESYLNGKWDIRLIIIEDSTSKNLSSFSKSSNLSACDTLIDFIICSEKLVFAQDTTMCKVFKNNLINSYINWFDKLWNNYTIKSPIKKIERMEHEEYKKNKKRYLEIKLNG